MKNTMSEDAAMDLFRMVGKKYLVTGASSGIGQATAVKISQLGGRVVLNGRDTGRLEQTLSMLDGEGHYVMPYDMAGLDGIKGYVDACIQMDGKRFDGLVFSTGIVKDVPIRAETVEQLQHMMTVNYFSYFSLLKTFSSRRVLNDQGAIVAVSSASATGLPKSQVSYASSKTAINAATVVASREFIGRGVRVNSVQPGMTLTPLTTAYFENATEEQINSWCPLGAIHPEDIANTIVFLLSDMSKKITGQSVCVTAGNDGTPINLVNK